jgi:hypothetical protein
MKYELGFHIPEDVILHSHRRGNLRCYILCVTFRPEVLPSSKRAKWKYIRHKFASTKAGIGNSVNWPAYVRAGGHELDWSDSLFLAPPQLLWITPPTSVKIKRWWRTVMSNMSYCWNNNYKLCPESSDTDLTSRLRQMWTVLGINVLNVRNAVFCNMTMANCCCKNQCFRGTYRIHFKAKDWVPLVRSEDAPNGGREREPLPVHRRRHISEDRILHVPKVFLTDQVSELDGQGLCLIFTRSCFQSSTIYHCQCET